MIEVQKSNQDRESAIINVNTQRWHFWCSPKINIFKFLSAVSIIIHIRQKDTASTKLYGEISVVNHALEWLCVSAVSFRVASVASQAHNFEAYIQ